MSTPRDLTVEDLAELMTHAMKSAGRSDDWIHGYLAAQRFSGWLRPQCPAWIRNSAGVHYALPHADNPQPAPSGRREAPGDRGK